MKQTLLLLISLNSFIFAADMDHQCWGAGGIKIRANAKTQLILDGEARYYENGSLNSFDKMALGVQYSLFPWLALDVNYWNGRLRSTDWVHEQKPELALNFKYKFGNYTFSTRQKYEYRLRDGHQNYQMYKNRVQLQFKDSIAGKSFQHYLNNEFFYNLTLDYANINRVRLGTQFNLTRHLRPDVGLVFQSNNRRSHWDHVLALAFKLWFVW